MSELQSYREYHPGVRIDEDEISLTDIWLLLMRRRWVIAAVAVAAVVLGGAYALLQPKVYSYTTSIEIGTRGVGENSRPIDNPETVLAKVQESYVPLTLRQLYEVRPEMRMRYDIEARIPKQSQLVVLTTTGETEQEDEAVGLLSEVIEKVRADHSRIVATLKKDMEIRRNQVLNRISALNDDIKLLGAEAQRIDESSGFIGEQIKGLQASLEQAKQQRKAARDDSTSETGALSVLLLESELRETMRLISELQLQRNLEMANQKAELVKRIEDTKRKQEEQRDQLSKLQIELANFRETRAVVPPMQSLEPLGPSRALIVAIAAVLGVMGGIFAAFFLEFLGKVREREAQAKAYPADSSPRLGEEPEAITNNG